MFSLKRFSLPVPGVSNVGASKTVLVDLPLVFRINGLTIVHGYASGGPTSDADTVAAGLLNITEIRLIVDGNVQRTCSGTQLRDLLLANGTAYDVTGVPHATTNITGISIPYPFEETWRGDRRDREGLSFCPRWQGGGYRKVQLQIDLGTAVSPTLAVWGEFDEVVPDREQPFTKWQRESWAAQGAEFGVDLDPKDWLTQISLYPDTGGSRVPSGISFKLGTQDIFDRVSYEANKAKLLYYGMTPSASGRTASIYDLVFDRSDALATAPNLALEGKARLTIRSTAAAAMSGNSVAIIQRVGLAD